MDCGGPVGGIAGLPIIAAVGGRKFDGDAPGIPPDCENGGCWPKGDGLGPELGIELGLLRFKFCILSANEAGLA